MSGSGLRACRALCDQPDELLRPPAPRRRRRGHPPRVGAERHGARPARHGVHAVLRGRRSAARAAVGQDGAPQDSGGRRVRLEPADRAVGPGAQLLAADRRAPRRRRRRGDVLAGVDVAHRRSVSRPHARARAVAIWMLGLPLGLGLANGAGGWILQNWGWRNAFYVAAVPGVLCAIAAWAMHEPRAARSRRTPSASGGATAIPFMLVLSIPTMLWIIAVGRAAQLQHVRARRVRRAVSGALPSHELRARRLDRGVRLRLLRHRRTVGRRVRSPIGCIAKRVDGRLIVGTAAIVICTPLMFLGLERPAGDVLGFALLMGTRRRRDVRVLLHRLLDDSRRRRAVAARHGDGAVLLRDVRARRVARAGRHRPGERLLHVPGGERRRRGRAAAVRRRS